MALVKPACPFAAQRTDYGWRLFLPLPPSVNKRQTLARWGRRKVLTREARQYLEGVGGKLLAWTARVGFAPIADRTRGGRVKLWGIFPRTSCDPSNYEKVLFDALKRGGVVKDDRYILEEWRGVWFDRELQQIVVEVPA